MSLSTLIARLTERTQPLSAPYWIPGLWINCQDTSAVQVNPYEFYRQRLQEIVDTEPRPLIEGEPGGGWSKNAIIYNLFARLGTAFDHDCDGDLSISPNDDGWRETGTLLKCIALLPLVRYMGFNTIHLLPITAVGQDGNKGNLGSPYAIRNPYRLDETLDEPALGLSAEQLFAAFTEAAHRLGFRVVMEFVLRTSSKDGDFIKDHPEWFYWIKEEIPDRKPGSNDPNAYSNPIFPVDLLHAVKSAVGNGHFDKLPPPPLSYREMFTVPPRPEAIQMQDGRWIGTLEDGTRVRIPGAFSDWPPDDNQPPWGDVTYLRMFDHPDFNYIAYNTIRMYDTRLAQPANRNQPLWDAVIGVIPHYQRTFGIDGVMIDMGHALPIELKQAVIAAARKEDPGFAFWDENFGINAHSRDEGYNAVMGYWVFDVHMPQKVRDFIAHAAHHPYPVRFFAAPENHNTPRAASRSGGLDFARYALILSMFVPGMPFVLSGFELGETRPVNTGLGFTDEMLAQYPSEALPLFSSSALPWHRADHLVEAVRQAIALRLQFQTLLNDDTPETFALGHTDNPSILGFLRRNQQSTLAIIANGDPLRIQSGRVTLAKDMRVGVGLLGIVGTHQFDAAHGIPVSLAPGQVMVLELKKDSA